jgi:septum formation protein
MGKPGDAADARRMIRSLSGRWHRVYTGLALVRGPRHMTDYECTRVAFRRLTEPEITSYFASGEPSDKAGAYAIQGLGTFLVRSINGSYTNVVGLPVCEVIEALMREGVITLGQDPEAPAAVRPKPSGRE